MKFTTLVEMFEKSCQSYGSRDLFGVKRDGAWHWVSYAEIKRRVDDARAGLASLGVAGVNWSGVVQIILVPAALAPFIAGCVAAAGTTLVYLIRRAASNREHRVILEAIARGSETEARAAMEAHLRQVETALARIAAQAG